MDCPSWEQAREFKEQKQGSNDGSSQSFPQEFCWVSVPDLTYHYSSEMLLRESQIHLNPKAPLNPPTMQTVSLCQIWLSRRLCPAAIPVPNPHFTWAGAGPQHDHGSCSAQKNYPLRVWSGDFYFANFWMKSTWFYISLCIYTKNSTHIAMWRQGEVAEWILGFESL